MTHRHTQHEPWKLWVCESSPGKNAQQWLWVLLLLKDCNGENAILTNERTNQRKVHEAPIGLKLHTHTHTHDLFLLYLDLPSNTVSISGICQALSTCWHYAASAFACSLQGGLRQGVVAGHMANPDRSPPHHDCKEWFLGPCKRCYLVVDVSLVFDPGDL